MLGRGVDDREVELLVGGSHRGQQIEDLVHHGMRTLLGAIDLVHDDQRTQTVRERLADHEARLGHHPLDRVDEQQHRIHQAEHAFHFAAEIRVARRVDEVNPHPFEFGNAPV